MNFRSTAVVTQNLTVCKGCRQPNGNGYQYCDACHKAHSSRRPRKAITGVPPNPQPAVIISKVDPEEVFKICAQEA
jgi:hypothetical protein